MPGNKTVLISGGTRGIGKAALFRLLEDGFNVSAFSSGAKSCSSLKLELSGKYKQNRFLVLPGDVTDEGSLKIVIAKTLNKFKSIDILINNAGIGYFAQSDTFDRRSYERQIDVNLSGAVLLTGLVVPQMKKQKSGTIINIVSTSGRNAFALGEFYSASKFALMGYSIGIRQELKEFGIRVCTICPGMVNTEFFSKEEIQRRIALHGGKMPEMLDPMDVARAISFVCSEGEHCDVQDITLVPF